jgi:hypothetical protein
MSEFQDRGEETQVIRALIVATAIAAAAIDTAQTASAAPFYENCDAAREAGAAPVYEDEPGYGPHLDRDRDGIGCE